MATAPRPRSPTDFKPGVIVGWPAHITDTETVAARARYYPDGKHKDYPAPNQEWRLTSNSEGTKCLRIRPEHWPLIDNALRDALREGVIGPLRPGGFPDRAWAFVNDRLHEARLSNPEAGWYHAFPLDYREQWPADPRNLLERAPRIDLP